LHARTRLYLSSYLPYMKFAANFPVRLCGGLQIPSDRARAEMFTNRCHGVRAFRGALGMRFVQRAVDFREVFARQLVIGVHAQGAFQVQFRLREIVSLCQGSP